MDEFTGRRLLTSGSMLKEALIQTITQSAFGAVVILGVYMCFFFVVAVQFGLMFAFADMGRALEVESLSMRSALMFLVGSLCMFFTSYAMMMCHTLISTKVVLSYRGSERWMDCFSQVFSKRIEVLKLTGIMVFFVCAGGGIFLLLSMLFKNIALSVMLNVLLMFVMLFFCIRYFMVLPALGASARGAFEALDYGVELSRGRGLSIFGALFISGVGAALIMIGLGVINMFATALGQLIIVFGLLNLLICTAGWTFYSAMMGVAYAHCDGEAWSGDGDGGIDVEIFS